MTLQPAPQLGHGKLTTPFAKLPNEQLEGIFLFLDAKHLARCREVCRIWNTYIKGNIRLCIRIIPYECIHKDPRRAWHIEALFNLAAAREKASKANDPDKWFDLLKREIAENNLNEARVIISRLGSLQDEGYKKLAQALIANFDFEEANEVAIQIQDRNLRFEIYLQIAEADPYQDYSYLTEKLETERYQKNLTNSELAGFHARCAKLFPPHNFTLAKAYAKRASETENNSKGYFHLVLTQALYNLNDALDTFLEIPENEKFFILPHLVGFACEKNPELAEELMKHARDDYERRMLQKQIARRASKLKLDAIGPLDRFDIIIDRIRLGHNEPELLEEAKKIARNGYEVVSIVKLEAKIDVDRAVATITTFENILSKDTRAACWLAVAKNNPLYIPTARTHTLTCQPPNEHVQELAEITSAFAKLSLERSQGFN